VLRRAAGRPVAPADFVEEDRMFRPVAALLCASLSVAALLGGCMPRAETPATPQAVIDGHNSRNALDWSGTYEGVLPCADCPGIKTRLVLHDDGRFELQTQYLERDREPRSSSGRFTWNAAGSGIVLDAAGGAGQQFLVGEGRLLQMNRDGTVPPWNSPHRILNKVSKP
jgi:uncharacterized lipoprotein NlpE involved in copper resistance